MVRQPTDFEQNYGNIDCGNVGEDTFHKGKTFSPSLKEAVVHLHSFYYCIEDKCHYDDRQDVYAHGLPPDFLFFDFVEILVFILLMKS